MTKVVNMRHRDRALNHPTRFTYIGRPSKWGNPFVVGRDGTREEVVAKYRVYILQKPELLADLPELAGRELGCWCVPLACHGDVLVELLDGVPAGPVPPAGAF